MRRSPSHYDGKPIGTPTDAKSAFHAGVSVGPDQVERMEEQRRLRNRIVKAAHKAQRRAKSAEYKALPQETREALRGEWKQRRKRADNMTRALANGKSVKAVAEYWGIASDDVLVEVKWLSAHRSRHRARHRKNGKIHPPLPVRGEP